MVRFALVSWSMPPGTTGSAIIVGNLAQQFSSAEMVVIGGRPPAAPPVRWDSTRPRRRYASLDPRSSTRGGRSFRRLQFPLIVLQVIRLCRSSNSRAILAVFPDELYLAAGLIASRVLRIPFVPYFHNTYVENRGGTAIARALQAQVFKRASCVLVMSEGMQRLYAERYPHLHTRVLPHSFSEALPSVSEDMPVHTPMRIAFSGNVNRSCEVPMARLVEALKGLDDITCEVYSGTDRATLKRIGVNGPGFSVETLSRDDVVIALRQADLLLLPHGFGTGLPEEEMQTIFPTKTIEYLISGRPILAHVQAGTFLAEFLERHQCAYVVTDPSLDALRDAVERLRSDGRLRKCLVENALKAAKQFEGQQVAQVLREVIAEAVTSAGQGWHPHHG